MIKRPPCFETQEQYDEWLEAAEEVARLAGDPDPVNYCTDCTPEYKAQMLSEGRCGFVRVKFIHLGGKAVYGRRPRK